ncbi:thioredoxin domain-containing protein [Asticcacaulis sp. YBE204]|uniref:thioredoxin domain-containing protein n=1 Tax=Asticcacaulis sp. YBE204 TaxID=1282363 RepID=UPI0003C3E22D|nr:thioredoxin domain-containing protein [Asticcacaulis sp. YBE204]ESQ77512.1 hypothetical protein AEYBE204_17380 [Asticcacaulis sp. YBE204]
MPLAGDIKTLHTTLLMRKGLWLLFVAGLLLDTNAPALARTLPVAFEDMSLGKPNAPVTLVVYVSVTSTHSAAFYGDIFPTIQKRYIRSGKVHYVLRELPTSPLDVSTAGFLIARCAGEKRYFPVVEKIIRAQPDIFAGKGKSTLENIARSEGLFHEAFTACITDQAAVDRINTNTAKWVALDNIEDVPTLIINGQKYTGDSTDLEQVTTALDQALLRK